MPTQRPRITITETEDVARMLDEAAVHWPEEAAHRGRLLARLARRGAETVRAEQRRQRRDWAVAVAAAAGAAGPDAYPPGYLDDLRGDWPA